ncbi:YueI family protein [Gracilibacillus massiliensis]|uniref:YueI family protein n=1 Tax=Gracilibacillus massiliensis TaxID=1564956 RepID=UPI00071D4154|nr:YueI family protein [Gracilibacillus massiliensis]
MAKKDVDDYLQEGIYGPLELHPDQKRKYMGTYRERVVLALTKAQVRGEKGLKELEQSIQTYPQSSILMNGNMNFRFFKPYRELANKHGITYTSVTNREAESEYGLVLAAKTAVDKEEIFLPEEPEQKSEEHKQKKPWWKKLLGI